MNYQMLVQSTIPLLQPRLNGAYESKEFSHSQFGGNTEPFTQFKINVGSFGALVIAHMMITMPPGPAIATPPNDPPLPPHVHMRIHRIAANGDVIQMVASGHVAPQRGGKSSLTISAAYPLEATKTEFVRMSLPALTTPFERGPESVCFVNVIGDAKVTP